jgi:hypothetical protein
MGRANQCLNLNIIITNILKKSLIFANSFSMQPLSSFIQQIQDHRNRQGLRHPFHPFISMIVLAHLGGYNGLNEMSRFITANSEYFKQLFNLSTVPGYTILRTFCAEVNFDQINKAFYQWASQYVGNSNWFSVDGKGMRSTSSDPFSVDQNFKAMVSIFNHEMGIVLASNSYENKGKSEIHSVQELVSKLEQKGMVLTLDALHCQKKLSKPSWIVEMSM